MAECKDVRRINGGICLFREAGKSSNGAKEYNHAGSNPAASKTRKSIMTTLQDILDKIAKQKAKNEAPFIYITNIFRFCGVLAEMGYKVKWSYDFRDYRIDW